MEIEVATALAESKAILVYHRCKISLYTLLKKGAFVHQFVIPYHFKKAGPGEISALTNS